MPVGFIAQVGYTVDDLIAHQFRHFGYHFRFVHLIRDFGDDDGELVLLYFLYRALCPHDDRALARGKRRARAAVAEDYAAGGKVGTRDNRDKLVNGDVGIVDISNTSIYHLAQVMRRDIRCHAHGNTARAVHQHIRKGRRQHFRLFGSFIIVRHKVDGIFIDIVQKRTGRKSKPCFGVTHGGRLVAVHRTKVPLRGDKWQAHGKVLRHTHHGFVDGRVTVGMILTHNIADDTRGLAERLVIVVAAFLHRIQDAAVDGL